MRRFCIQKGRRVGRTKASILFREFLEVREKEMNERDTTLIDAMESIRVRNNRNWMDLVRLALEVAPRRTRALLRDIAECDSSVRDIIREIAES